MSNSPSLSSSPSSSLVAILAAAIALSSAASTARSQTAWDPNAVAYAGPSSWQQAAVAALNRQLPADSGYWVLGPIDLTADLPDTTDLVRSTLRIITPDPRASRNVTRRFWVPTGGVALEELQPSDTLPHELPPGYSGRFLEGTIVGEQTLVQVFTIQEHRWLLWAQRAQVAGITDSVTGPIARYAAAVTRHLAAVDSGRTSPGAPMAVDYGLEPIYDLYAPPPEPVVRGREGYLRLLAENRDFSLGDDVRDVEGFVPGPPLIARLEDGADSVLFQDKDGEVILQHRYRDFGFSGGRWTGYPILSTSTLRRLRPGRYIFVADRYGVVRVARAPLSEFGSSSDITAALIAHGEPLRAAGELVITANPGVPVAVTELNVMSEEYFFSNFSLTLYGDVERRSDRYVRALGHVLKGLEQARVPVQGILIRKY